LFINTLPVICAPKASQPVGEWLRALQAQNLAAREHEHTPLYEIQRWAGLGGQGLFDSILVFENFPVDQALNGALPGGLRVDHVHSASGNHYPFTVRVLLCEDPQQPASGPCLRLDYLHAEALVDVEVALRLAAQFERLLQALAMQPVQALGEIDMLDAPAPLATVKAQPATSVLALWQRSVAQSPQTDAVRFEEQAWSYQQLDEQSERLAQRLRALGVGPEVRVGVHAPREGEFVLGLLAVLKAGG
ncbi:AMP-binding protein, partial [Aquabacterium sp. CECT 9606]|uniref:AMP-binding protein n=1 Tax=Aquabacterium sp. CECT 9606 TaxID=2845822 RepID=UPI001E4E5A5B